MSRCSPSTRIKPDALDRPTTCGCPSSWTCRSGISRGAAGLKPGLWHCRHVTLDHLWILPGGMLKTALGELADALAGVESIVASAATASSRSGSPRPSAPGLASPSSSPSGPVFGRRRSERLRAREQADPGGTASSPGPPRRPLGASPTTPAGSGGRRGREGGSRAEGVEEACEACLARGDLGGDGGPVARGRARSRASPQRGDGFGWSRKLRASRERDLRAIRPRAVCPLLWRLVLAVVCVVWGMLAVALGPDLRATETFGFVESTGLARGGIFGSRGEVSSPGGSVLMEAGSGDDTDSAGTRVVG